MEKAAATSPIPPDLNGHSETALTKKKAFAPEQIVGTQAPVVPMKCLFFAAILVSGDPHFDELQANRARSFPGRRDF